MLRLFIIVPKSFTEQDVKGDFAVCVATRSTCLIIVLPLTLVVNCPSGGWERMLKQTSTPYTGQFLALCACPVGLSNASADLGM